MAVSRVAAFEEVIDFLTSAPAPEHIVAFRPSEATQARVRTLLELSRAGTLSPEERAELDEFEQIEHFMRMIKARARQKLAGT